MATFINKNKTLWAEKNPWLPNSIEWYENQVRRLIKKTSAVPNHYKIKKNICYNLQYLEYLDKTLEQLNLTTVLQRATWKTYIITAISIIEAILFYLVKKNETKLTNDWVRIDEQVTSPKQLINGKQTRFVVIIEEKKPEKIGKNIKFSQLLKKVEKN